ncbi:MAG: LytR C-terminal domain-containing protein [Rhodococcus sp.]|nr:LytR C-terminal domain-containing protein [Rhodococcus sp. (in: high G+C Gram-positive bacteria)]
MSTQKPASSGPPLRALAMVLIALAILFAGLGFASMGKADSEQAASPASTTSSAAAPTTTTYAAAPGAAANNAYASDTTTTEATTTESSAATTLSESDKTAVGVRVLNNSSVSGLAGDTASELTGSGWTVTATGNYNASTVSTSTVYYGTGETEEQAAKEIAAELGITAEPRIPAISDYSPGVIVIMTSTG